MEARSGSEDVRSLRGFPASSFSSSRSSGEACSPGTSRGTVLGGWTWSRGAFGARASPRSRTSISSSSWEGIMNFVPHERHRFLRPTCFFPALNTVAQTGHDILTLCPVTRSGEVRFQVPRAGVWPDAERDCDCRKAEGRLPPVLRNHKIGREWVRETTREVFQYYAIISLITWPCTSVRRKSRPLKR